MEKNRIYAAIDLKSFYASVECIERGLDPRGYAFGCGRCKPYRENNLSCSVTIAQNLWDSWKSQIV